MSADLVPIDSAPAQIQNFAEALTDVSCCTPVVTSVRSFSDFGNDTTWEIEVTHELVHDRNGDGRLWRHGRRTVCRIVSFDV